MDTVDVRYKWQPVMAVSYKRVECACGAMAVFIVIDEPKDGSREGFDLDGFTPWCQSCWEREQGEG